MRRRRPDEGSKFLLVLVALSFVDGGVHDIARWNRVMLVVDVIPHANIDAKLFVAFERFA
jgi:hypothetical protein